MKKKKFDVTYLSIDSIQEGVGSSQIIPLILGLAKRGKSVCLITFEKTEPPRELIEEFVRTGVVWVFKDFGRPGLIGGIIRLELLRRCIPSSSILHARSDVATVAGIWSRAKAPTLWDVRSLWSDQRRLIGTSGWNLLTARGARVLENVAAKYSVGMSTLTAAVVPVLEQRHKRLPKIREVIPTCVQVSLFLPSPIPKSQMTCLLSGTFNNYYDLERTRIVLQEIRKTFDLRIIWARAEESPTATLGVGEDIIITASHSEMPRLIRDCHFGIAICKEVDSGSLSAAVPTKIGEFLASGRPVIVGSGMGDFDKLLPLSKTGLVIAKEDSLDGIAQSMSKLINDPKTPNRCRALALQHFDMEKSIDRYIQIYERMQS
jgi:hypothetical protein